MISSMTGYGKAVIEEKDIFVEVEIKSLNSRFLDFNLKIPRILSEKELEFKNIIKERIKRGKISLSITLQKNGVDNRIASIKEENLNGVVSLLNELKNKAGLKSEISLDNLLEFQNVIFTENGFGNEAEFGITKIALENALTELINMRRKEGRALIEDLKLRINNIAEMVEKIMNVNPEEIKTYFGKLRARIEEIIADSKVIDERLITELGIISEKYDVTEECIRLKSHINQFNEILAGEIEVGRRLNFLAQEMNREANTINSKSISIDITRFGISIKEELEKIREQIQNLE